MKKDEIEAEAIAYSNSDPFGDYKYLSAHEKSCAIQSKRQAYIAGRSKGQESEGYWKQRCEAAEDCASYETYDNNNPMNLYAEYKIAQEKWQQLKQQTPQESEEAKDRRFTLQDMVACWNHASNFARTEERKTKGFVHPYQEKTRFFKEKFNIDETEF